MTTHELTCIGCPMGCALTVTVDGDAITVTGNTCPKGEKYAVNEVTAPMRMVTGTVALRGGELPRLPVKTAREIPKGRIFDCMEAIRRVAVDAPVAIGAVVLADVAGTGVDVIATREVRAAGHN